VHHGDGGGSSRPSAVRAAWILGDGGAVFNLASFDGLDVDAVRCVTHRLMSRCACVRLTLLALGAGRAFIAIDPTSDVSRVIPQAPRIRPQPSRSFEKPAGPSPQRVDPVKGTCGREPRRLRSCSDTKERKRSLVVCFSRIWSVPFEAWRTGSPGLHLEHASASSGLLPG